MTFHHRLPYRLALFLAASLLCCAGAFPQKDTGSIAGTVRDTSGARVVGAKVTVADVDRGQTFTTQTSEFGEYVAGPLPVGTYTAAVQIQFALQLSF